MKVISNTTPLIGLASIGQFELLHKLFGEIIIPKAVYDEVVIAGREEGGAKREVSAADWIKTVAVEDQLAVEVLLDELDRGEAEVIILAREMNAEWTLMDEKKGRRKLAQLEMKKIGTVGILLKAKEIGEIESVGPGLAKLRENGFSISQYVVDRVLQEANEK